MKEKTSAKCAKRGHFAKACRSKNVNFLQNNNDDPHIKEDDKNQNIEENDPVAFAEFTSQNG